jgi:hypothetical protein
LLISPLNFKNIENFSIFLNFDFFFRLLYLNNILNSKIFERKDSISFSFYPINLFVKYFLVLLKCFDTAYLVNFNEMRNGYNLFDFFDKNVKKFLTLKSYELNFFKFRLFSDFLGYDKPEFSYNLYSMYKIL